MTVIVTLFADLRRFLPTGADVMLLSPKEGGVGGILQLP